MTAEITQLYESCQKDLLSFLYYRIRCLETAEDLMQEAFLILVRTRETAQVQSPRSFLYRTAANLVVDYIRHQKVVERHLEKTLHHAEEPQVENLEQQISSIQSQVLLQQTLSQLPPKTRDIMILNRLHGLSYKQIAQTFGISESAIEKHISRGLQHCRNALGSHFLI